ncbi:MAG: histone deacetylase [Planctomycetota bacterium]
MSDPHDLVWYAAYGSNLLSERFAYYLEGGELPDVPIRHPGARDAREPQADRAVLLQAQLVFTRKSAAWGGGIAFLDVERTEAVTWGRAWLITREQFEDVLRQENGDAGIVIDWDKLLSRGRDQYGTGWYNAVRILEADREGYPLLTCTAAGALGRPRAPGENYLGTIIAGLVETYNLGRKGVVDYLSQVPGISPRWSKGALGRMWQEVIDADQADANESDTERN